MVIIFVVFIYYVSLCWSDFEYCHAGTDHNKWETPNPDRNNPDLPCYGKCKGPYAMGNGCPDKYTKIKDALQSRAGGCKKNDWGNWQRRNLCMKDKAETPWEQYITKGETDDAPSCKNRRCKSGTLFGKGDYCRPDSGEDCPEPITSTNDDDTGLCWKYNKEDLKIDLEQVSFCKTEIHFQWDTTDSKYKRMSLLNNTLSLHIIYYIIYIFTYTIIRNIYYIYIYIKHIIQV